MPHVRANSAAWASVIGSLVSKGVLGTGVVAAAGCWTRSAHRMAKDLAVGVCPRPSFLVYARAVLHTDTAGLRCVLGDTRLVYQYTQLYTWAGDEWVPGWWLRCVD